MRNCVAAVNGAQLKAFDQSAKTAP